MKYIKQFAIIAAFSFAGEVLHAVIPLPIPASIYGIVLLFAGLATHRIPVDAVKDASRFLIEIMPVLFIPAAVGLMESWGLVKRALVPYLVITVVSTIIVMAVSGLVTQAVISRNRSSAGGSAADPSDSSMDTCAAGTASETAAQKPERPGGAGTPCTAKDRAALWEGRKRS